MADNKGNEFAEFIAEAEARDPEGFARARAEHAELSALRKDAERYRWLRANNSHHLHNSAWLASLTAVKDGPCDIFSADEVPALLDAEIDRRMARAVGAA